VQSYNYSGQRKPSFFQDLVDNVKQGFEKNKELKQSIKEFRQEAKKLEESDALKEARNKFKDLGSETDKGSKMLKEKLESLGEQLKESDLGKRAAELSGEAYNQAKRSAKTVIDQAQDISETKAFKAVSGSAKAIKENIDEATQLNQVKPYRRPEKLRKRSEIDESLRSSKVYEANEQATGMELHKDTKIYQAWQNFKDNNQYVNKLFEFKSQYDESDNPMIRVSRVLTDKFKSVFGGLFQSNDMSQVLTEITKCEPDFELNEFMIRVQNDIIPNILESLSQMELEILKDWCTEAAYTILTHPITQCEHLKMKYHNTVLDISHLDIAGGKIMEQGPVLIVTFIAQQIIFVTDSIGKVIEGDKDKIKRVNHVWVLFRDQTLSDPNTAWRLMECASHQSDQFV
jgi:import inner membrane translocase subunit TIM44